MRAHATRHATYIRNIAVHIFTYLFEQLHLKTSLHLTTSSSRPYTLYLKQAKVLLLKRAHATRHATHIRNVYI